MYAFEAVYYTNFTSFLLASVFTFNRPFARSGHMLVSKLRSGTSKTKAGPGGLARVALFWKSHCATCSPACVILYHVTGSCKGPITGYRTQRVNNRDLPARVH